MKWELSEDEMLAVTVNLFNWYNNKGISDESMHMVMMEDHGYNIYS